MAGFFVCMIHISPCAAPNRISDCDPLSSNHRRAIERCGTDNRENKTMTTIIESLSPMLISLRDSHLELNAGYESKMYDMD
jgi:hypothetical protein